MTEGNYTYDAAAKLIKEKYADMAYCKEALGTQVVQMHSTSKRSVQPAL